MAGRCPESAEEVFLEVLGSKPMRYGPTEWQTLLRFQVILLGFAFLWTQLGGDIGRQESEFRPLAFGFGRIDANTFQALSHESARPWTSCARCVLSLSWPIFELAKTNDQRLLFTGDTTGG